MPSLYLNGLAPEDAIELSKKRLMNINYTEQDVNAFAEKVQYNPLTLELSIAYINEQHKILNSFGKKYDIQDYLREFDKEIEKLPDDFKYNRKKITFTPCNLILNAIKNVKKDGENAILILQILAYLYLSTDKIDSNMFSNLLTNDDENENAFYLLEIYSLIKNMEEKSTFYQIHPAVQELVQMKFKKNESEVLKQAIKLIDPDLHDMYESKGPYEKRMEKCSPNQLHLYENLKKNIAKYEDLLEKYRSFYEELDSHQQFFCNPIDCYAISMDCGPRSPPSLPGLPNVPSDDELDDNRDEPIKNEPQKSKKFCNVL